ncbi:MAG: PD40 domain-containing protein [Blastocatellia bacterium]|nr:PD40 domain-containing protein [Blastocatellia bacterium]
MAVTLPAGIKVTRGPGHYSPSVALSPDGRTLVIAGTGPEGQRLYQRPLDRLQITPIAGTEGASSPFFSPDGTWLGFFADGRIRRMPAAGGAAVDVAKIEEFLTGASWGPDDQIVFTYGINAPLSVVRAAGGDARPLISRNEGEPGHSHPEILPDGRTVLFQSGARIHALDIRSGRRAELVTGTAPHYTDGQLIYARGSVLLAVPFDPGSFKVTGPGVPLVEGVAHEADVSHYAISRSGVLAYLPGATAQSLALVNGGGSERSLLDELQTFENPRFSPDGARLAVAAGRRLGEPTDIWIHDLRTGAGSRLTFDGGRAPVWTPDGASITFSKLDNLRGIYTRRVDGRGDAEQVVALNTFHWLVGWTPDTRTLVYGLIESANGNETRSSIMALTGGRSRRIVGPGSVWGGRLSPDGRLLAYYTLESGLFQVYLTTFPNAGGRWLISEDRGRDPSWGRDDTQLYYRSGDRLMAARIDTTAGVRVISRRLVLTPFSPPLYDDYHVHPDGQTLAVVRPREESDREVAVVLDWLDGISRGSRR